MNRRRFLSLFACSAGALPLLGMSDRRVRPDNRTNALHGRLCNAFSRLPTTEVMGRDVASLGAAYLRDHPDETDPDVLVPAILNSSPQETGPPIGRQKPQSPRDLDARIRSDFAHGRTVHVEGWVLSRTEARLCALSVLS